MKDFALVLVVAAASFIGPFIMWSLDREPPYVRYFGRIVAEDAKECGEGIPDIRRIVPGACVAVEWSIHVLRRDCYPVGEAHVSRWIKDSNGDVHALPKTERVFGPGKRPIKNPLRRAFIHPLDINRPGPAVYHSESCFTCNPSQWLGLSGPVCISTPDAEYEIQAN